MHLVRIPRYHTPRKARPGNVTRQALFQDGKPVYMLHRTAPRAHGIAGILIEAFDQFCVASKPV